MTARILVVEDDPQTVWLLRGILESSGYGVVSCRDGGEALHEFSTSPVDLVLLDLNLPDVDGLELCAKLRRTIGGDAVPIFILTARSELSMKISGIESGADDYITKPFDVDELLARVAMHLRRSRREQQLNPLTRLPGNPTIESTIQERLDRAQIFGVLYVDLDSFKAYNDCYGFHAGDRVIETVGNMLRSVVSLGHGECFAGHVGGDDFIVVCDFGVIDLIASALVTRFDAAVADFYDRADLGRGYIEAVDRQGQPRRYPLLSVSVAGVTPGRPPVTHPAEIAHRAAQIKGYLKRRSEPGSRYLIDRRHEPHAPLRQLPGAHAHPAP